MNRGGASPSPTPVNPLEGVTFAAHEDAPHYDWPTEGTVNTGAPMIIFVPKEKFPTKDDIGYVEDDAEVSHNWSGDEGDFWTHTVPPMPDHANNVQLVIDGQIVGGIVHVS